MFAAYFLQIAGNALRAPRQSKRTLRHSEGAVCFVILHYEAPSARLTDGNSVANGTRPDTLDQSRMIAVTSDAIAGGIVTGAGNGNRPQLALRADS
jgi:hypothetical protein